MTTLPDRCYGEGGHVVNVENSEVETPREAVVAGTDSLELARYITRARPDLSPSVTHWTKRSAGRTAFDNLKSILSDRVITASQPGPPGFIKGPNPATCFSETPISVMARVFGLGDYDKPSKQYVKYEPYGLSFKKAYIHQLYRGRPVISFSETEYQSLVCKKPLESEIGWRVVTFDYHGTDEKFVENTVDWTHEREWRVCGDVNFTLMTGGFRPLAIVRMAKEVEELMTLYPVLEQSPVRGVISLQDMIVG